jgi:hypothetical protein
MLRALTSGRWLARAFRGVSLAIVLLAIGTYTTVCVKCIDEFGTAQRTWRCGCNPVNGLMPWGAFFLLVLAASVVVSVLPIATVHRDRAP